MCQSLAHAPLSLCMKSLGRAPGNVAPASQEAATATSHGACSAGRTSERSAGPVEGDARARAAEGDARSAGRALSSAVLASQRATSAAACGARSAGRAPWSAVLAPQMATFAAACAACGARSCAVARGGGTRAYCLAGSHQG